MVPNRCNFKIEYDKQDNIFHIGEPVTGTLTVTSKENIDCNKIKIQQRWKTHGKGHIDAGDWLRQEYETPLKTLWANQSLQIPFSFEIPLDAPVSYSGHLLNIDWYIKAIIDSKGPLDPSHEEELIVLPNKIDETISQVVTKELSNDWHTIEQEADSETLAGLFWLIAVLALLLAPILIYFLPKYPLLTTTAFLLSLFVIGPMCFKSIRNVIASQKFGKISLRLSELELRPNELLHCQLNFIPKNELRINKISFKLEAIETVFSTSGSNRISFVETVYEETQTHQIDKTLLANEHLNIEQSFRVPIAGPISFASTNNYLSWKCTTFIDIENWANWEESVDLKVRTNRLSSVTAMLEQ